MPNLPPELILQIIDALAASSHAVALPASDPTTIALRSLTLVSRLTYATALRALYSRCLYISGERKLRLLLCSLSALSVSPTDSSRTLPPVNILPHLKSLFLSPFVRTIDNLPVAQWVHELLSLLRTSLERLVIDMPLRSLDPWEDHLNVRYTLWKAFSQLQSIEEFVSVRDELYLEHALSPTRPCVWKGWLRLRRLALYNQAMEQEAFHDGLAELESLKRVVLGRPDHLHAIDLQEEMETREMRKELRISIANKWGRHDIGNIPLGYFQDQGVWMPSQKRNVDVILEKVNAVGFDGNNDPVTATQEWMKKGALDNSLWD